MYVVDDKDTVSPLEDAPPSSAGAPLPVVVRDEQHLFLAYIVSEPDPDWDGTYVNLVGPETEGLPVAIVRFEGECAHMFGPPNDEAFSGHPLASRGLRPYGNYEIGSSSWIRALEQMNAVHPYHTESMFADYRHFVFAFHDSTFECVAEGFAVEIMRGSMRRAAAKMAALLDGETG